MRTKYRYSALYRKFSVFCKKNNVSQDEVLSYCEGRLSNFPYWYVDYINKTRAEIKNRLKTGVYHKVNLQDVWS